MALFCCQNWTVCSPKNNEQRAPRSANIAGSTKLDVDYTGHFQNPGLSRLIDVGGGTGELLAAVLLAYPSLRGAVLDQAACAAGAKKHFHDAGISDRAEFVAGDFFKTIPGGADALILKSTIHDWNDQRSACVLANCRKALPSTGKLILVERIMPEAPADDADPRASALSDLNMLRGPGGQERTAHEYAMLLNAAGFRIARIIPAGRFSLIEALAA